jgi:hypothetical protein
MLSRRIFNMASIWKEVESLDEIPILGIWSHNPEGDVQRDGYLRIKKEYCSLDFEMIGVSLDAGRIMGCDAASGTYLYIGEE